MDLTPNLPSYFSGNIFPSNMFTSYRVILQKYTYVEVPHACALTMPTRWNNIKCGELFLGQVEKEAPIPPDLFVRIEKKDDKRTNRSAMLRRGGKISRLRRLIETAFSHRPVASMFKRTSTTTPAVSLPHVSHQAPPHVLNVIPQKLLNKSKGVGAEAVENREEEEEEELDMDVASEDDDETVISSMRDDGTGTSTSKNPLPTALTPIEKIAKKVFKGVWSYTRFILEGGRVETNRDLVHILNQLVVKKTPLKTCY